MANSRQKIVIVGDTSCGKTSLIQNFSNGTFNPSYTPKVSDVVTQIVTENNGTGGRLFKKKKKKKPEPEQIELALWDTASEEEYDRLRPLSYPDSHAIVICFALDDPSSLHNVEEKWISEVLHFCTGEPILLVGCKSDLRGPRLNSGGEKKGKQNKDKEKEADQVSTSNIVAFEQGEAMRWKIGAVKYIECSALTGEGVKEAIESAVNVVLLKQRHRKTRFRERKRCTKGCSIM